MKKLLILLQIILMMGIKPAFSADETNVYVLPAVFKSQNINNDVFEKVYQGNKNYFIDTFVNTFKTSFPNIVSEISDTNKYNTFVAYLNLPRVSQDVIGNISVNVYIPMTGTLTFANLVNSEILYSESITERMKYSTSEVNSKSPQKMAEPYKKVYTDIVNNVIKNAKAQFKPFAIEVKVADKYKNLYILDKGLSSGIAKGDLISDSYNNQLSVVHSELDYAIAYPILGSVQKDSIFKKYTNSSISQIKKPKILFVNDFSSEKIYNLFAAALGSNADFSLMTINKSFADMQTALESLNNNYKHSNMENRQIPEYFIKLHFITNARGVYKTNKSYNNIDKYALLACANIFNYRGEVLYSTCATDEVTDEDINTEKFSADYQAEVLAKNIFNKLAKDLSENVKFKNATIPIDKIKGENIILKDSNSILNYGDIVAVMKRVKTDKISSEVVIPTWIYKVVDINGSNVECSKIRSLSDDISNPSKKDFIIKNAISQNKLKTSAYNFVIENSAGKGNVIDLSGFDDLAFNIISSNINLPVSVNSEKFKEQIDELNNGGYGFRRKLKYSGNNEEKTIEPKYIVKLLEEKKKGNFLEQKYEITCGIIVKDGKNAPKKNGIKQQITIMIPQENNQEMIRYELLKNIIPLLKSIAINFK